jgi:hypothetical protein
MKHRTLILIVLCVVTLGLLGAMSIENYDTKTAPSIQLPEAYAMALQTLGAKTNGLFCTKAFLVVLNGAVEWQFHFYGTNGNSEGVNVYLDRNRKPDLDLKGVGY